MNKADEIILRYLPLMMYGLGVFMVLAFKYKEMTLLELSPVLIITGIFAFCMSIIADSFQRGHRK